jgi:DNA-binding transcriptional LysR family regulator
MIDETLSIEPVLDEPLVAALPAGHSLSARPTVSVRELATDPFILFPRSEGPGFYDQILSFCHHSGFSPRVVQEASQMQTILSLVAAGVGAALIPASVQSLQERDIVYKRLREPAPRTGIAIAWRQHGKLPVVDAFLTTVRDWSRAHRSTRDVPVRRVGGEHASRRRQRNRR